MTVPMGLMRQHPHLALVFSGGEGLLLTTGVTESELAHSLLRWQTALHEWLGLWVYGVTRGGTKSGSE